MAFLREGVTTKSEEPAIRREHFRLTKSSGMEMSLACEQTKKKATEAGIEGPVQNGKTCGWRGVQIK